MDVIAPSTQLSPATLLPPPEVIPPEAGADLPPAAQAAATSATTVPLCVDLDGTLIRSDVLVETLVRFLRSNPLRLFPVLGWLLRGRAHLKAELARRVELDVAALPINEGFVAWLRAQKGTGRKLVLCTAADGHIARRIADHLGLFDAVIASDGATNLGGRAKARRLTGEFGTGGFDYAANERTDLPIWQQAHAGVIVAPPAFVRRYGRRIPILDRSFETESARLMDWARALRLHQWAKNLLMFVPLAAAHRLHEFDAFAMATLAFLSFGCCASGTYLINDLADLDADRHHPHKRHRPLAAGQIPLVHGILAAGALVGGSLLLAALLLPPLFAAIMVLYVVATLWYSLALKRIAMVDVLALAGLYTVRILAGGAATAVMPSFWLLAFSMFLFLSLAAAKRYAELRSMLERAKEGAAGRGYAVTDLPLLHSFGISSGYLCVLVLALYINSASTTVAALYARPQLIWLLCPLLLYWISRIWLKTFRGQMHEDPVVFALTDRPSLIVAVLGAALVLAASS